MKSPWRATVKRRTWPDEWINHLKHLKFYNIDVGQYE